MQTPERDIFFVFPFSGFMSHPMWLYRMYQGRKTYEELGEFLKAKTKEQKAALEVDKRIAPFVLEVKAERAKEVDVEDLLADLEY